MALSDVLPFMGVMLITGTANTLLMKHQVMLGLDHPFFQTVLMMLGELACLGVFYFTKRGGETSKDVPAWFFLVPCSCDWAATTFVNAAYIFLAASVIQMTRGAIVIFTCVFSMIFLGRKQEKFHLLGVGLVFLGLTVVSLSTLLNGDSITIESKMQALLGLSFCIGGQVFQASMIVFEEKVMKNADYEVAPLQMVGMEGLFGCIIGVVLLIFNQVTGIEDSVTAMGTISSSGPLATSVILSICSIAFFNWSGITVTQKASATSRSTIDSSRTILIWMIELALQWNSFNIMQLIGFVCLAAGTMIYNQIIDVPGLGLDQEKEVLKP